MKKLILLLMASLLLASTAFAVVDADPDMIGMYFDTTADTACLTGVAPYATIPAYIVLTNPTFEGLYGFEVGYELIGEGMVVASTFANPQALDVGFAGNHIVGFGSPTLTTDATVLINLSVLYMDTTMNPLAFNIGASYPSSNELGLPSLLLDGGVIVTAGFSTIDGVNAAAINGVCEDVVATEPMSFDSVKSLYR